LERRPQLAAALKAAKKHKAPVIVAKLDRLSCDVHFISGLMSHKTPFIVTELGSNVDLSLSETQSCWQLISNRAMLLPYARGLQPNLVGVGRSVPVAGLA